MRAILLALGLAATAGCGTLQPIGPFAKQPPITQQGRPLPGAATGSASDAVAVPAVRPTPPSMFVTPADVDPANPYDAVQKITSELEADRKSAPTGPVTAEISRYKGGVKQP